MIKVLIGRQREDPWVVEFRQSLKTIRNMLMTDLVVLAANETKLVADVDTLLAANAKAVADLAAANVALAAAIAANDPVAQAAVQAQIDDIATALGNEAAKVEDVTTPPAA